MFTNSFSDSTVVPVIVSLFPGNPRLIGTPNAPEPIPLSDFRFARTAMDVSVPRESLFVKISEPGSDGYLVQIFYNNSATSVEVSLDKSDHYFVRHYDLATDCTLMTEDGWGIYLVDQDKTDARTNYIYLNPSFVLFDFGN